MKTILRHRPTPAMAISLTALFVALSGTAVALPGKNRVDSNDYKRGSIGTRAIANNSVRSSDIRRSNVFSSDIRNESILGEDVRNDTLKGDDVDESSLGTVPSAANANTVGNQSPAQLRSVAASNQNGGTIASLGTAFVTVASTTLTTQSPGLVQANGSAGLAGANNLSEGECRILLDGVSSLSFNGANDDIGVPDPFTISVNSARTLSAGVHTATLQCRALAAANAVGKDDAAINVTGTPAG